MKAIIFVVCLSLHLVGKEVSAAGGSCWAAPVVFDPACESNTALFGHEGYVMSSNTQSVP